MLWSIDTCQNKVSADQCHMTIPTISLEFIEIKCFLKLITDQVLVFNWIMGSCQINLL